ncbi:MAG: hypothetical protein ACO39Z_06470, partial [Paracoccaceae bacterium]
LIGNESLFQRTALHLRPTNRLHFAPPITVTHNAFRFTVAQHFQHIDIDPGPILIEPSAKNTAPAILAACFYASQSDPDAVLLICLAELANAIDEAMANCAENVNLLHSPFPVSDFRPVKAKVKGSRYFAQLYVRVESDETPIMALQRILGDEMEDVEVK